eukprot:Awhi_evm1s2976
MYAKVNHHIALPPALQLLILNTRLYQKAVNFLKNCHFHDDVLKSMIREVENKPYIIAVINSNSHPAQDDGAL